jgi:hypothetical protein
MEKPKIRLIVGWRAREARVREIRQRMRPVPTAVPASGRVLVFRKKP